MRKTTSFVLTCVLTISLVLNLWLTVSVMKLNSEIAYLKQPVVHLITYDWCVLPGVPSWEFEYVQVNFTLFNSGYADAEFTLSIDVLDQTGNSFLSEQMLIQINATSKREFNNLRFVHDLLFDSEHQVRGIEFYCIYFFENSLGYESSIH